ncbi:MAG: hypothetical protein LBE48_05415 [Methanomassiliicoccaceae archaeon]|jgi:hypothetical protein|nr:hypothetical protein [Methanomassiliicoccaceae archaeon]
MYVPVIPIRITGGNAVASHMTFSGTDVLMTNDHVSYGDLMNSLSGICDKGTPMIVVDIDGLQKKDISAEIIRKLRPKREMWLMTGIRDSGDVMDAFHGSMSKLIVPYHMTTDIRLNEMIQLSDCCIPALFTDSKGVHTDGIRKDLRTVVRNIERTGFRKMLVFDVSGDHAKDVLSSLTDLADLMIPYASSKEDADMIHERGFKDVMVSGIKLFRSAKQRSEIQSCMLP